MPLQVQTEIKSNTMAVTVERVHLAMAHGAMPGLLPTPPEWKMLPPLLPTPPAPPPSPSPPRPCPCSAAPTPLGLGQEHFDQVAAQAWSRRRRGGLEREQDRRVIFIRQELFRQQQEQQRRASSWERWDTNKKGKSPTSSSSSSSSASSSPTSRASSCGKWERTKRPVSRGSLLSSAEHWDAHKKPQRRTQAEDGRGVDNGDDGQSSTGSNDMEVDDEPRPRMRPYAGPGFLAVTPPEPTMLPIRAFLVLPRFIAA